MGGVTAPRTILVLRVNEILVPEGRFRTLKAEQAAAIGASIAIEGQFDPIAVSEQQDGGGYILVDGWHRLEGCRQAGIETIEAQLVAPKKVTRVKREVLSGLARAAEDVFDRAAAIDALAQVAREEAGVPAVGDLRRHREGRHPKVIEQEAESSLSFMTNMLRWDEKVAEQLGLGARMVRRLAIVHERIPAEMKARLRELGHANDLMPLHELARFPEGFMARVVEALAKGCKSIAEAIAQVQAAPKLDAFTKFSDSVFRKAKTLTPAQRQAFLADWLDTYHEDGRRKGDAGSGREG